MTHDNQPTISYTQLTAAAERKIAEYRQQAEKTEAPDPIDARRTYQAFAHGVLILWVSLATGPEARADLARLTAMVDAIAPV